MPDRRNGIVDDVREKVFAALHSACGDADPHLKDEDPVGSHFSTTQLVGVIHHIERNNIDLGTSPELVSEMTIADLIGHTRERIELMHRRDHAHHTAALPVD